jgi:hypothetical protein
MRLNRTAHTCNFTVLGNALLRRHELSFAARGLLAYLLSLPDSAREDVRTLAQRSREGRTAISRALNELVEASLYVRRTIRDPETGRVWTEVDVYEVAPGDVEPDRRPLPVSPAVGVRSDRNAGTLPPGVKTVGEEPPSPAVVAEAATPHATADGLVEEAGAGEFRLPEIASAAALLARVARSDPRLSMGAAEVAALAPLAGEWLRRDASESSFRAALTAGLPDVVHSAAAFLRNRLERKMPTERKPSAVPRAERHRCIDCKAPLEGPGRCRECSGSTPEPPSDAMEATLRGAARIRELCGWTRPVD